MLRIVKPGLQSTLQGAPRLGQRQFGLPYAGPADSVSMALANRLVGNEMSETALEITYGSFEAVVEHACAIAVTGAESDLIISGTPRAFHETLHLNVGDTLSISPPIAGARAYLAIHSGFVAAHQFGATSTYLPAGLGGMDGRALQVGDLLRPVSTAMISQTMATPETLRPTFSHQFALRACESAETRRLGPESRAALFSALFTIGRQATRMGLALTGSALRIDSDGKMPSAAVFPGTVQCPPSGVPIVLSCDAQTTGGYPRIASIARCDRHLLGQMRPGDQVRLLRRTPDAAADAYRAKQGLLANWLEG